ncbi:TPA: [formate-C-acetyltransferase]-activating enzyme [Kluyvera ascorbata]|uniref:[formate-C-acetyltransferase]-activating enzyme n=1 Tax=Kluyvera TaxID=579 RepID=UPI0013D5D526|nr:[formate-C-acetyltransferase]-activating enzyme [Kluyvera ascorbata]HCR3981916.1 [formate-C-acetyltransferase]-activating enzyme [Kluyvera ascorbata]HDT6544395.1 [formate-C-acetyltransferase]-activating enzyme [Kluyvera ascorbata]
MTLSAAPRISCEVIETRADTARIFNIQRYSLNDGQGIRTVVFFKGCPHTCPWCANPESMSPRIETVRRESKCLHCATCLQDAEECPSGAWENIGRDVTLEELEREVLKDEVFFRASGGGVTLSGGEVLMQAEFAARLVQRLKQWGIRTAIETAGDTSPRRLLPLARECDEVLFDLKIMDTERARTVLNMNQPRVLENFRLLLNEGIKVIPRLPLIPGFTLNRENVAQILAFLAPLPVDEVHLLPFHQYGEPKYALLDRAWVMAGIHAPEAEEIAPIQAMVEQAGYRVVIGG